MGSVDDALADWRTAAHHEAGHAVAAFILGYELRSVSIGGLRDRVWDWSGETETCSESEATVNEVICRLAGPMAEAQFLDVPGLELPREACRCETDEARAIANDLGQSYDDLKGRAVELVAQQWPSIQALADCFADADRVSGVDATRVIRDVGGAIRQKRHIADGRHRR